MLQGLAHFLEHMLFLGSTKYPNGDDYFKTITENNGHFNAYTDREITNYFFDIHFYSFENALDIFSRFFIDPLFNNDKVSKEVNAVNSEFEKNLIIDNRKRSQIMTYLAQADNPYHRFTTGNIETLVGNADYYRLNLRDELIKFHSKYYTSDKMKLIVFSNDDLEDLEDMVINKFSEIKPSSEFSLSNNTINTNKLKQNQKYHSPYNKDTLGTLIRYDSLNAEHEFVISFIQSPLSTNYNSNPAFYFSYLLESKEENSLIDILKKKQLATKLTVSVERDVKDWSDLSIQLYLTIEGGQKIDEILQILHNYLNYMRSNLINKKTFDHLQKISRLNFEYRTIHSGMTYEFVNKLAAKSLNSPIEHILDNNQLIGDFNQTVLHNYANNLKLENSIMQIPTKMTNSSLNFLYNNTESFYEPWYRTNFTINKINFNSLNTNNTKSFSHPEYSEIKVIDFLLKNTFKCDYTCVENLKSFRTDDPSLINRTSTYEYWYRHENTLDFNRTSVQIEYVFDKFNATEDRINMILLEALMRRKIKKINSKLNFFGSSIKVSLNHYGLKLSYISFNANAVQTTHHIVDKLANIYKNKEFNGIYQEVKDILIKEYNSQPFLLAYEYMKEAIFKDYVTSEDYLEDLSTLDAEDFDMFMENFKNNFYLKIYISGDLDKKHSDEIFETMSPLLKPDQPEKIKKIVFDIGKKRKNKRKPIQVQELNYLIKKVYHQDVNKNNALLKCYKIGRADYKNEILIHLFHNIIGNIVFRELRTNRQFGYVAKSKIELIDTFYFYCLHVQGSSKPPEVMDKAAYELINDLINIFNEMTTRDFMIAKKKNLDTISSSRLDLQKQADIYFRKILDNNFNFQNYFKMEKFSKSITLEDFIKFYEDIFLTDSGLKMTIWMYSKKTNMTNVENSYIELK